MGLEIKIDGSGFHIGIHSEEKPKYTTWPPENYSSRDLMHFFTRIDEFCFRSGGVYKTGWPSCYADVYNIKYDVSADVPNHPSPNPHDEVPEKRTAEYTESITYNIFLLKPDIVDWEDVPFYKITHMPYSSLRSKLTGANDYAVSKGYATGFPTFQSAYQGQGLAFGVHLIKKGACVKTPVNTIHLFGPRDGIVHPSEIPMYRWYQATAKYAEREGFGGGMPSGHWSMIGGLMYLEVILFRKDKVEKGKIQGRRLGIEDGEYRSELLSSISVKNLHADSRKVEMFLKQAGKWSSLFILNPQEEKMFRLINNPPYHIVAVDHALPNCDGNPDNLNCYRPISSPNIEHLLSSNLIEISVN